MSDHTVPTRRREAFAEQCRRGTALFRTAWREWREDNATMLAAAVAFYAAFSLAPLMILLLSAAGTLFGAADARARVLALVTLVGSARAARAVERVMISAASSDDAGMNALSVIVVVISASTVFRQLKRALHVVLDVPIRKERGVIRFVRTRAFAVVVVVGVIVFLVIILAVTAAMEWLRANTREAILADAFLWRSGELLLSFVMLTMLFGIILRFVPDVRLPWRPAGAAASLAAIVFVAGKLMIALYVTHSRPAPLYGGARSLTLVLIYVYFTAFVLLAAAELAEVLTRGDASFVAQRKRLQQNAGYEPRKTASKGKVPPGKYGAPGS